MKFFKRLLRIFYKFWRNTALFLGSVLLFLFILMVIVIRSAGNISLPEINQKVIYHGTTPAIAYVRLTGEITSQVDDSWLGFNPFVINPIKIRQLFAYLAENHEIKIVVVEINSPGGSVAASEEIYQQMKKLSAKKTVLAYLGETAASGGYYIALPAHKIMASVPTITGSIGVIVFDPDLSGLYEKVGVKMETYQTGRFKDIGSINRSASTEEIGIFNAIIDDSYQLFLDRIVEHRPLSRSEAQQLADGRIFSGTQAQENGLIDAVGSLDDVFSEAAQLENLTDPSITEFSYGGAPFSGLLGMKSFEFTPLEFFNQNIQRRMGMYYLWTK